MSTRRNFLKHAIAKHVHRAKLFPPTTIIRKAISIALASASLAFVATPADAGWLGTRRRRVRCRRLHRRPGWARC